MCILIVEFQRFKETMPRSNILLRNYVCFCFFLLIWVVSVPFSSFLHFLFSDSNLNWAFLLIFLSIPPSLWGVMLSCPWTLFHRGGLVMRFHSQFRESIFNYNLLSVTNTATNTNSSRHKRAVLYAFVHKHTVHTHIRRRAACLLIHTKLHIQAVSLWACVGKQHTEHYWSNYELVFLPTSEKNMH